MSLEVVSHRTAGSFLDRSEGWLLEAEDLNNLVLSLTYGVVEEQGAATTVEPRPDPSEPFFATVEEAGRVVGAVFRSPPHQVLLTDMPSGAAAAVARRVADAYPAVPAVLGPPTLAESFAREWVSLRGGEAHPGTEQRLYRVDEVTPLPAPGRLRTAGLEDADQAAEWAGAFSAELRMHFTPSPGRVADWLDRGQIYLWEDGGEAVSMAVAHGRTRRGARVGYVYTPPDRRRRGYAGACVAELSRRLLDSGLAFCVLYADLSNPTTNALYQRMGYRAVADVLDFHLHREAPR